MRECVVLEVIYKYLHNNIHLCWATQAILHLGLYQELLKYLHIHKRPCYPPNVLEPQEHKDVTQKALQSNFIKTWVSGIVSFYHSAIIFNLPFTQRILLYLIQFSTLWAISVLLSTFPPRWITGFGNSIQLYYH